MPWEYLELRRQLGEARRLMILNHGKPEHGVYKQMCRAIEADMRKALQSPTKEMSA